MKKIVGSLPPSSFALVMATGIVSTALSLQKFEGLGNLLFWLNQLFFLLLLLLFLLRLFLFFPRVREELASHQSGAGFLTLVAASCILGTEWVQAKQNVAVGRWPWVFALLAWFVLLYSFLAGVILKKEKPSPEKGMDGSWLLLVVSTQGLAILANKLVPAAGPFADGLLLFALSFFLLGVVLYLLLITIDLYRLLFFPVKPEEVVPSYWINMGAAAITTLSGVLLSQSLHAHPLLGEFYGFVKAAALLFWATASFWIPLVLLMEIWRYAIKRTGLQYDPAFWSLVFPLGMYSVCTIQLQNILPFSFLHALARLFLFAALLAWLLTLLGLCFRVVKTFRTTPPGKGV